MQWNKKAMKMVFLVGDAPPQNYPNESFSYQSVVKDAVSKGITINTVRCGNNGRTGVVWQEIASANQGVYTTIGQNGGMVAVSTPFDAEMAQINREIGDTTIIYGGAGAHSGWASKRASVGRASPSAAADRASYYSRSKKEMDDNDVLDKVGSGKVSVDELETKSLPSNMKVMSKEERKKYVATNIVKRKQLKKKLAELAKKRGRYLKKNTKMKKDSFDGVVREGIAKEGAKHGIEFE